MNEQTLFQAKEILKEIHAVCEDFRLDSLKKVVQSVHNFTDQRQYLDIAVLGQFKAGKSSFLNGYLQQALLPVGSIPVTSVITRIGFGPREKATVTFRDGTSKIIPTDEIEKYVSESKNPENKENVMRVDIEVPSLNKMKEIRLVDTPGIGSVWKHNTETTSNWFPETGAVLFVLSAEKPISEHELNLFKEISLYSPEIALVITKTDLFQEEQVEEIASFTRKALKEVFARDVTILRYSAYINTSAYNKQVEKDIFLPLARNRRETYLKILHHKIETVVHSCLSYLNISYQASLKKEAEKNKLKEIIFDEHLNAHFIRQELLAIMGSYKEKTRESVKIYLDSFRKDIEKRITKEYETAFPGWKGNLDRVTRQFEKWLNQSLDTEFKGLLLEEEKSFELLHAVKKHLSYYLKSFRERLSENLDRALGVQMKPEAWEISVGELKKPDISLSRSFDFHLELFWFFFPMFLYRRVFRRFFLSRIPYEIEKNLHRLTSDMNEKINQEIDHLMLQALTYINGELKTMEMLLSKNKGDSTSILKRMDHIKNRYHNLMI
ncbi:dynamin family protein [Candidatus Formimonas warabiya]|uniref:Dynamin N-terminal domain-containing protein n=1 Tax=Formimonas warabiya TaxID=1761012 RepID=A0A3G1KRY0_FORW1|nr:dynamin family protein [Candidatus Formimonas warabiya]ATW25229.1 hypothetical protein DCMF_11025 [Candidatus Formimonas warabiya]